MAKVIAIDRNERRLRYVLADIGARAQVTVLHADVIDVPPDVEAVAMDAGNRLREQLAPHKASRAKVLVGVGRGELETVEFTVPSAEEADLPLMVRNLAMRNLSSISDETPLDFLAGPERSDGSRDIVAMTTRDEVVQELQRLTTAAQMSAARILVRPYELRSFLADPELASQVVLMVGSSSQVTDVLLVHPDGWQLARSIQLSEGSSSAGSARRVVNEIRRTLFTLPVDDFSPAHINRILLFAGPDELQPLATELGTALDAPVQRLNPFSDGRIQSQSVPTSASEFAPLVGMLLGESERSHPIDFLNPRRPPPRANRRKTILAAAVAAAAVLAGAWFLVHRQFSELDKHNADLVARRNELKKLVEEVQPKLRLAAAIDAWEDSQIRWLDELRDLTVRMPPSRDLTVQRFSASSSRDGNATVTFSGESRAPEIITLMEQTLRDDHHAPRTPGVRERPAEDRTIWTFQTTMIVKPRSPDEYSAQRAPSSESALSASSDAAPKPAGEPH